MDTDSTYYLKGDGRADGRKGGMPNTIRCPFDLLRKGGGQNYTGIYVHLNLEIIARDMMFMVSKQIEEFNSMQNVNTLSLT